MSRPVGADVSLMLSRYGETRPYVLYRLDFFCVWKDCGRVAVERFSSDETAVNSILGVLMESVDEVRRGEIKALARRGRVLGVFVGRLRDRKRRNILVGAVFRDGSGVYVYTVRLTRKEYKERRPVLGTIPPLGGERSLHELLFGRDGIALQEARRLGKLYAIWLKRTVPVRLPFYYGDAGIEKWNIAVISGGRIQFYSVPEIRREERHYSSNHNYYVVVTRLPPGTLLYRRHLTSPKYYTRFVRVTESGKFEELRHRVHRRTRRRKVLGLGEVKVTEKIFEVEGYDSAVYSKCFILDGVNTVRADCDMICNYEKLLGQLDLSSLDEGDFALTLSKDGFKLHTGRVRPSEEKFTFLERAPMPREYWRRFYTVSPVFGRVLLEVDLRSNEMLVHVPAELEVYQHRAKPQYISLVVVYHTYRVSADGAKYEGVYSKDFYLFVNELPLNAVLLLPVPFHAKQQILSLWERRRRGRAANPVRFTLLIDD